VILNAINCVCVSHRRAARACFIHLFVSLLGDFKQYLLYPKVTARNEHQLSFQAMFNQDAYLASLPKERRVRWVRCAD